MEVRARPEGVGLKAGREDGGDGTIKKRKPRTPAQEEARRLRALERAKRTSGTGDGGDAVGGIDERVEKEKRLPSLGELVYQAGLQACKDEGDWESAMLLMDTMRADTPRNAYHYTTAILTAGKAGKYAEALGLFEEMGREGLLRYQGQGKI